jgi:hypothetical protein
MNTKSVVDQMTTSLAQRRQLTRDRRSAYLALAHAILSDAPIEQQLSSFSVQPSLVDRHAA